MWYFETLFLGKWCLNSSSAKPQTFKGYLGTSAERGKKLRFEPVEVNIGHRHLSLELLHAVYSPDGPHRATGISSGTAG